MFSTVLQTLPQVFASLFSSQAPESLLCVTSRAGQAEGYQWKTCRGEQCCGSVEYQGERVTHQEPTVPVTRLRHSQSRGCRKTPGVHRPLGSQGKRLIWNSPKSSTQWFLPSEKLHGIYSTWLWQEPDPESNYYIEQIISNLGLRAAPHSRDGN